MKRKATESMQAAEPPRRRQKMEDAATTAPTLDTPAKVPARASRKRKAEENLEELAPPPSSKKFAASPSADQTAPARAKRTRPMSEPVKAKKEKTLMERVQALPPELYCMIKSYTFCAGPTHQVIDENFKSPSPLSVSRQHREEFAVPYYNNASFTSNSQSHLRQWLLSLTFEHRAMIRNIHVDITPPSEQQKAEHAKKKGRTIKERQAEKQRQRKQKKAQDGDMSLKARAEARRFFLVSYLRKKNLGALEDVVKVNVQFEGMEKAVWTNAPGDVVKWERERRLQETTQKNMKEDEERQVDADTSPGGEDT
jgi:hypothetical protein